MGHATKNTGKKPGFFSLAPTLFLLLKYVGIIVLDLDNEFAYIEQRISVYAEAIGKKGCREKSYFFVC